MHQLPDRRGVDRLGGRHQGDAVLAQLDQDLDVIDAVSVHPRELVDDDVVHVLLGADAFEHHLEGLALVQRGGAFARLDVGPDDLDVAHLGRFAFAGSALGRDGEPFGVVVGIDL